MTTLWLILTGRGLDRAIIPYTGAFSHDTSLVNLNSPWLPSHLHSSSDPSQHGAELRYAQYRFGWGGSYESSHLNRYCLYLSYTCPKAGSNGYLYGTHSAGSNEAAQVSLLIWICTVYTLTYICSGSEPNGYFYGTHSAGSVRWLKWVFSSEYVLSYFNLHLFWCWV